MRRFIISWFILLTAFSLVIADNVFVECSAMPGSNQVKITWITRSEDGVAQFVILRSNDDANYVELERITPKGAGSQYEFTDRNVMFKDISVFFYKVRAVDKENKVLDETSLIVHPSISDIYRTWGAIKAMFR
ncbi:MAG: hypothetical protein GXO77_00145 [Calditrichaeota bacterium]|nr:hypothetical protein [Calditrichota bacterium]